MIKNKTEQNRNDEKHNQTGITVKIHKLISFPIRSMEGHISHCSRVSRRCHPERSLCSGKFDCRSLIKHSPWTDVFYLSCEKLACFYEPQFCWVSLNISLLDSVLETKKLQAQVLNSTRQIFKFSTSCRMWTLMAFELWWFDIFDSFSLVQPIRLFEPFWQGFWLAYCSVFYGSLHNKLSYARILIGSLFWSIGGQSYRWRHH